MVAPGTIRRIAEAVEALEARVMGPPKLHVLFQPCDMSDEAQASEIANRRALGLIKDSDLVVTVRWFTKTEAEAAGLDNAELTSARSTAGYGTTPPAIGL